MSLIPFGYRVIVKPITVEEHDDAYKKAKEVGIVFMEKELQSEQSAVDKGYVVSIGPTAFEEFGGDPWCKVGDLVVYARHAGKRIKEGDTEYLVLNDSDLVCGVAA